MLLERPTHLREDAEGVCALELRADRLAPGSESNKDVSYSIERTVRLASRQPHRAAVETLYLSAKRELCDQLGAHIERTSELLDFETVRVCQTLGASLAQQIEEAAIWAKLYPATAEKQVVAASSVDTGDELVVDRYQIPNRDDRFTIIEALNSLRLAPPSQRRTTVTRR